MQQLSPIDSAFVLLEQPRTPYHVNMVNIFDPATCPGDAPTYEDICEAIELTLPLAPTFRRKIVRVPLDLDYPYWVEDADFDLEYHMRHLALPKPGNWDQFRAQVARLIDRPLDLTRPPWEMTIIDGLDAIDGLSPGCFAMVLKVHHSAIDGAAGVELLNNLYQQSPEDRPQRVKDRWRPEPVPTNTDLLQRAWVHGFTKPVAIARLLLSNASSLARAVVDDLRHEDEEEEEELHVPKTRLNGTVSAHRVWDDVRCSLDDLKRVRRRVEGATINDVCLAIVGEAMRRYLKAHDDLPRESLVTAMPISTRTPEQAKAGGNQITVTRVSLHTDIDDPIERVAAISEESREKKAVQDGVVMPVLLEAVQNLPGALVGVALRALPLAGTPAITNTMLTNVPGPLTPYYLLGAKVVRTTGCSPMMDGGGLLHSVCSYNGEITFTFTGCREILHDADFYRDCLVGAVQDVIKAAGD